MRYILLHAVNFLLFISCSNNNNTPSQRNEAIQEIRQAEQGFAALCAKEGVQKAFAAYCDDSAYIRSSDTLVSDKKDITQYYGQPFFANVSLHWSADFADASESGDMGYTFGHYTFATIGSTGKRNESKGIFHTVWKKKNGAWKFVWDN